MRKLLLTLALVAAAAPLAAQGNPADPDRAASGGGTLPPGWHARVDRADARLADVSVATMPPGFHVTTGPAVILWNPEHMASGEFRAHATIHQTKAPTHPEAYGIFINGGDLAGSGPNYMYFIIRGDGKYMVRHRAANGELHTIQEWTENAAIHKQDAQGQSANTLVVEAGAWGVRFKVNGTQVSEWLTKDVPYLQTAGQVGLRVNHNLDVHVAEIGVDRL